MDLYFAFLDRARFYKSKKDIKHLSGALLDACTFSSGAHVYRNVDSKFSHTLKAYDKEVRSIIRADFWHFSVFERFPLFIFLINWLAFRLYRGLVKCLRSIREIFRLFGCLPIILKADLNRKKKDFGFFVTDAKKVSLKKTAKEIGSIAFDSGHMIEVTPAFSLQYKKF